MNDRTAQNSAYDTPLFVRVSDPETSRDAMKAYSRAKMRGSVDAIVRMHKELGRLADFQQRDFFPKYFNEPCCAHLYRQARSVARDRGLLRDSGIRVKDPITHRDQIVWEACDQQATEIRRCPSCGHVLSRGVVQNDPT